MALTRGIGAFDDGTALVPGVGTNPLDVRKMLAGLFASTGVMPGAPSPLLTGTAGWAYSVAGPAWFVTSRGASDGSQFYSNDGAAVIGTTGVGSTVPVAPGAGLQRIDIAWTRHPTNTENGDTSSAPIFGVASGLAASFALPPTIPAGAIELGRNLMLSTATSTASTGNTISQTASPTSLVGTSTGPWTAYTPTVLGISLGNGTLAAAYRVTGKTLHVNVSLNFGSTTTYAGGAGVAIQIALPSGTTALRTGALSAWINDFSTGFDYVATGRVFATGSFITLVLNGGFVASVNDARPMTWASGDSFAVMGVIEIA